MSRLDLSRAQVLAYRRRVGGLDERLPGGDDSLRRAAWAGQKDSVPRAALLSLHARVERTTPSAWQDPALVQVWGPRFSAYVVAARDHAVFSLGRLPGCEARRRFAEDLAQRLDDLLDGREMRSDDAGRALGKHHNQLRYAATTGRVLIRWDGARRPTVRTIPPPELSAHDAGLELARRYLHVLGPATVAGFAHWAGLQVRGAAAAFEGLSPELTPVRTAVGDAWILTRDEAEARAPVGPSAPARLLPSGDAYYLFWGRDRELLVPEPDRRAALWTSRVWPGAVLVDGQLVGTWRRAAEKVTVAPWHALDPRAREAVEEEASSLPLSEARGPITVSWGE